jgi:hypothetical protein
MKKSLILLLFSVFIFNVSAQQAFYNVTAAEGNGLRFWSDDAYKIHMGNTAEYHYGPVTDYSIKTNMDTTPGRGWTWGLNLEAPIAALSNSGNMQIAGGFTARAIYATKIFINGAPISSRVSQWATNGSNISYATGNVGIGTPLPLAKLQVAGSIYSGSTRTNSTFNGNLESQSANFIGSEGYWAFRTSTNNAFNLDVYNSNSPIVALTALQNGNVGIGTTTPLYRLQVNSNQSANLRLVSNGSTTPNPTIDIFDNVNGTEFVLSPSAGKVDMFTYSNHALALGTRNTERMRIDNNSNVGIGTTNPTQKLQVKGTVYSTEVKVDLAAGTGPDYVFEPTYDLKPLAEIEAYIKENKHLPEVPSAKEMEANGVQLGEMNMLLLRKIEELTLYILNQNKEIEKLKERSVSPDASGKKVEELTLYILQQEKRIIELEKSKSKN